ILLCWAFQPAHATKPAVITFIDEEQRWQPRLDEAMLHGRASSDTVTVDPRTEHLRTAGLRSCFSWHGGSTKDMSKRFFVLQQ
ncbi:hypothetical protein HPB47_015130, partial [Ixodes persulcatus]